MIVHKINFVKNQFSDTRSDRKNSRSPFQVGQLSRLKGVIKNDHEKNHANRSCDQQLYGRFVKYTPVDTNRAPINRERVSGSPKIKNASKMALMGTKLMNSPALVGPI
jgi:hypothetical protein